MKRFPQGGQNFVLDDFSLARVNARRLKRLRTDPQSPVDNYLGKG
jgi:hypothetical protein